LTAALDQRNGIDVLLVHPEHRVRLAFLNSGGLEIIADAADTEDTFTLEVRRRNRFAQLRPDQFGSVVSLQNFAVKDRVENRTEGGCIDSGDGFTQSVAAAGSP